MTDKIVMEGTPFISRLHDGRQMLIDIHGDGTSFVRLFSWDETRRHDLLNPLIDKKLRVIIEVIK